MSRRYRRTLRPGQIGADEARDIHEEIELYLELRARELEEEGHAPEEARRIARERFGDPERIERALREQARHRRAKRRRTMTMGGLRQDLAYALRSFRRSPAFFAVTVGTLALALGGSTAIFAVVDEALLSALPFARADGLVFLDGVHVSQGETAVRGASFPEFGDWRERSRTVTPMAAVSSVSLTLTGEGEAGQVAAEVVTEDYFEVLGMMAERGRTFLPEEHAEPDAHPVVVISHALWERRFGFDPEALGSDMVLNDRPMTVVGILPEGFAGTSLTSEAWLPDGMIGLTAGSSEVLQSRGSRFLTVIGRLSRGSDVESARRELDGIARELQSTYPDTHEDRFVQVVDFREGYLGTTGGLLWILFGSAVLLLVIAAANIANLLLVRAHGRTREMALRRALGAERSRLARQLLTESVTLAAVGGLLGVVVAWGALAVLGPMIPDGVLPGFVEPRLGSASFAFSLAVLTAVGISTGLVPAFASARPDLAGALREGGRGGSSGGPGRFRTQQAFVVAQVALALVLLVGAGLLTRSFRAQLAVDTGVEFESVTALRLQLPSSRYDSPETIWSFLRELERAIGSSPGVESVALASDLPFRGGSVGSYILKEGDGPEDRIRYHRHLVTPRYFETLGIEPVAGRLIDDDDVDGSSGVIVITRAMAERVFPGENAVGRIMTLRPDGSDPVEIVGVIEDVRYRDVTTSLMADANSPDVFFSLWQLPTRRVEVVVRGRGAVSELMAGLRTTVARLDPDLPVFQLEPLSDAWRRQTATPRFAAFLMSVFSGLALLLACVGIYGVLAFTVGQRAQEIAIRRAIGATGGRVARSVLLDGVRLAGLGLIVGGVVAAFGTRVLSGFLFGVAANDPVTFATVTGAMIAIAVLAGLAPAIRATRRDPAEALNGE